MNWTGQGNSWQRIFDFGDAPVDEEENPSNYMFLTSDAGGGIMRFAVSVNSEDGEDQTNGTGAFPGGWHHVVQNDCHMNKAWH